MCSHEEMRGRMEVRRKRQSSQKIDGSVTLCSLLFALWSGVAVGCFGLCGSVILKGEDVWLLTTARLMCACKVETRE